jgi:hypothetical protein
VPRERASDVVRLGEERLVKEEKARQRLRNGELGELGAKAVEVEPELGARWIDEAE